MTPIEILKQLLTDNTSDLKTLGRYQSDAVRNQAQMQLLRERRLMKEQLVSLTGIEELEDAPPAPVSPDQGGDGGPQQKEPVRV